MKPLILIVDDEEDLFPSLEVNLHAQGFDTATATTGHQAIELARRDPQPKLILLDLMLPDIQGTEVCKRLRADERTRSIPVVMLTARAEEIDRVVGFEVGADDYVTKPFSVRELVLRVQAVLRRVEHPESAPSELRHGSLRLDIHAHRCWADEQEVVLTALEFRLLATLLRRKGRVQTRETLLTEVWGVSPDVTTRTVDTHVQRLRKKLGGAGEDIETLRGVGYRFRSELEGS